MAPNTPVAAAPVFGLTGETLASQGQVAIDADVHERLTHMATQARAEPGQFWST